ncbi:MAG: hypothetical protein ACW99A_10235 [Candidatus Kariarchaeaceae archaeon]
MTNREELEKLDINQLYQWVNRQYENYTAGILKEEEYLADLDYYKTKLALSSEDPKPPMVDTDDTTNVAETQPSKTKATHPSQVRSTSIAGLRKKLLDELNG